MELIKLENPETVRPPEIIEDEAGRTFITANTLPSSTTEMREKHIIPVFVKDNEPVISHVDFIEATASVVADIFSGETILTPVIRVSHPIKGRIPQAKDKPAIQLQEWEKTLYYERMAFIIQVPSIIADVGGNRLSLTVGGVKAYNLDNLYNKKGADEHFKVFIGFQNTVCTNLCVWTDGYMDSLRVKSFNQLKASVYSLVQSYNSTYHIHNLRQLYQYQLSEHQFAQFMGRCRMYQHLPPGIKNNIPAMLMGDQQIGTVCKDYYRDKSFCRGNDGTINLWNLYNLLTGANKTSYIDSFLDRTVNAYNIAEQLKFGLQGKSECWYLY